MNIGTCFRANSFNINKKRRIRCLKISQKIVERLIINFNENLKFAKKKKNST